MPVMEHSIPRLDLHSLSLTADAPHPRRHFLGNETYFSKAAHDPIAAVIKGIVEVTIVTDGSHNIMSHLLHMVGVVLSIDSPLYRWEQFRVDTEAYTQFGICSDLHASFVDVQKTSTTESYHSKRTTESPELSKFYNVVRLKSLVCFCRGLETLLFCHAQLSRLRGDLFLSKRAWILLQVEDHREQDTPNKSLSFFVTIHSIGDRANAPP
jgi:hypothetical protein